MAPNPTGPVSASEEDSRARTRRGRTRSDPAFLTVTRQTRLRHLAAALEPPRRLHEESSQSRNAGMGKQDRTEELECELRGGNAVSGVSETRDKERPCGGPVRDMKGRNNTVNRRRRNEGKGLNGSEGKRLWKAVKAYPNTHNWRC